jgi:hypothetical protein
LKLAYTVSLRRYTPAKRLVFVKVPVWTPVVSGEKSVAGKRVVAVIASSSPDAVDSLGLNEIVGFRRPHSVEKL